MYLRFRLQIFKSSLHRAFKESRSQSLSLTKVREFVNQNNQAPFSQAEIGSAIDKMTDDNQVMMADGIVFLI